MSTWVWRDVLVCRFADPGWAPLMALADTLMIDLGTVASHGAVVARELGHSLRDRHRSRDEANPEERHVRVDGKANLVTVLARADGQEALLT